MGPDFEDTHGSVEESNLSFMVGSLKGAYDIGLCALFIWA